MIRLLVVDDQALVRSALVSKLNAVEDFTVVAEAATGEQARELLRSLDVDVVLMDLSMPGLGGMETTRRLLKSDPTLRIIGLSMHTDGPNPARLMRLGAAGYVSKGARVDELFAAIRGAVRGQRLISADVAQGIAADAEKSGLESATISARELAVWRLLALGLERAEIGARLGLSAKTVTHHRRELLRKLELHNDVQLARRARESGVLTDND